MSLAPRRQKRIRKLMGLFCAALALSINLPSGLLQTEAHAATQQRKEKSSRVVATSPNSKGESVKSLVSLSLNVTVQLFSIKRSPAAGRLTRSCHLPKRRRWSDNQGHCALVA